jgi:DNA helicase-2/ATP-dependent DNA helicase PcrA
MRGRLRGLNVSGVQARTFHSAALRQLQYFWPRISGGGRPSLIESKLPSVRAAAARTRVAVDPASQRDVASEIEWAKAALVDPERYAAAASAAGRQPPFDLATVQRMFAAYEAVNGERGQLDFEDLLLLTAAAIEEHDEIAREVRGRYRFFVVDEYQDVSPLQQRLLDAWLGDRDDLCVVVPARVPEAVPGVHRRPACPRLPLHRAGRRSRQSAAAVIPAEGTRR